MTPQKLPFRVRKIGFGRINWKSLAKHYEEARRFVEEAHRLHSKDKKLED